MQLFILQDELLELARKWEKDITFLPSLRRPTCAKCGYEMDGQMWHCWLKDGEYFKEIHICRECGDKYYSKPKRFG